jgi:hypothetical protein
MKFGQVACSLGLLSYKEVIRALWIQRIGSLLRFRRLLLGTVMVKLGYLTEEQVEHILAYQRDDQYRKFMRLYCPHFVEQNASV